MNIIEFNNFQIKKFGAKVVEKKFQEKTLTMFFLRENFMNSELLHGDGHG